jgi:hypothetical protein
VCPKAGLTTYLNLPALRKRNHHDRIQFIPGDENVAETKRTREVLSYVVSVISRQALPVFSEEPTARRQIVHHLPPIDFIDLHLLEWVVLNKFHSILRGLVWFGDWAPAEHHDEPIIRSAFPRVRFSAAWICDVTHVMLLPIVRQPPQWNVFLPLK